MEIIKDKEANKKEELSSIMPMYADISPEEEIISTNLHGKMSDYILTTKSLVKSSEEHPELISEVNQDLKYKILSEFFNVPYNKNLENTKKSTDCFENYNFKF